MDGSGGSGTLQDDIDDAIAAIDPQHKESFDQATDEQALVDSAAFETLSFDVDEHEAVEADYDVDVDLSDTEVVDFGSEDEDDVASFVKDTSKLSSGGNSDASNDDGVSPFDDVTFDSGDLEEAESKHDTEIFSGDADVNSREEDELSSAAPPSEDDASASQQEAPSGGALSSVSLDEDDAAASPKQRPQSAAGALAAKEDRAKRKLDKDPLIKILRADVAGGFFGKHLVYKMQMRNTIEVTRRFSDFEWMRLWLEKQYPGAFVPQIPEKLPIALWPDGYLSERVADLERMLNRMAKYPHILTADCFKMFMSCPDPHFEKKKREFDVRNKAPTPQQLFRNLSQVFDDVLEEVSLPVPHDDPQKLAAEADQPEDEQEKTEWEDLKRWVDDSVKQFSLLTKTSKSFHEHLTTGAKHSSDFSELIAKLRQFENDTRTPTKAPEKFRYQSEALARMCPDSRVDIVAELERWSTFYRENPGIFKTYFGDMVRHALDDFQVMQLMTRRVDDIKEQSRKAIARAKKWKSSTSVRSRDVERKLEDEQAERDLKALVAFVSVLVRKQIAVVWRRHVRDWKRAVVMYAATSLEKSHEEVGLYKLIIAKIKADSIY